MAAVAVVSVAVVAIVFPDRVGGWWARVSPGADTSELRELKAAMARSTNRVMAGRLSGDFPYAPLPAQTRGAVAERPELPPDLRIAAALVEKRSRGLNTPAASASLGVAYIALADWDQAIDVLEEAVALDGGHASFQNDLSVAYLGRAENHRRPEDWVHALAAANRSIHLDPAAAAPHFNRAVALRGLMLNADESAALSDYVRRDATGPWSAEAAERLRNLRALAAQPRVVVRTNQQTRDRLESELLPRWAAAVERGAAAAASTLLAEADTVSQQLVADGGDTMPRDGIAGILQLQRAGDDAAVRTLATGYRLFGEARALYASDQQVRAADVMAQASESLRRGGSPYQAWAPVFRAFSLRNQGDSAGALALLATIRTDNLPPTYFYLRGRLVGLQGLLEENASRFDRGRELLARSVDLLTEGGELDSSITARTNLAEANWFLGDRGDAWASLMQVFADAERSTRTGLSAHFDLAASMALGDDLPEAALDLMNAELRVATTPRARSELFVRLAQIRSSLNDRAGALKDLEAAEQLLSELKDPVLTERIGASVNVTRTWVYGTDDCAAAMRSSDAAMAYLTRTRMTTLGGVLSARGACLKARGDTAGALAQLKAAVALFENRRSAIGSPIARVLAFAAERTAFKELLAFTADTMHDMDGALAVAERARAGVIADAWRAAPTAPTHRDLPADVGFVYFETLPDRVLTWVLTRDTQSSFSADISEASLTRTVARIQRAIERGATLATLRAETEPLMRALISPALARADASGQVKPTLVIVPDGPLYSLPFAALSDDTGRPLIDTRTIVVAQSLKTFLAASQRLARFEPTDVVSVGDSHDPRMLDLPRLAHADEEAQDVARLYGAGTALVGDEATKQHFLSANARVVHFAGHSILNPRFPMLSRMLFAPDPAAGDTGSLLASEIAPQQFTNTDVVFLASCDGAAGRAVAGEGAISVARAFFAAGVPAVVGSLWPVDDDVQTLVKVFHQTLIAERDPARALRAAQRALLAERGPQTPVRVWGGFVTVGGELPNR
jgi:CHAT domain-containing protein